MACLIFAILAAALQVAIAQQNQFVIGVPMVVINSHDNGDLGGSCPSKEELDTALNNITNYSSAVVQEIFQIPQCGAGLWYRIAHLNMSNPSCTAVSIRLEGSHNGWNKSLCTTNF